VGAGRIKEDGVRKWGLWVFAAAIAIGVLAGAACAQDWPTQTIRIIVPYPAGGLSDVFARLIADKLGKTLGQSVVVDNRPGGNTIIGTQAIAQAPPDGYTLLLTNAALSINQIITLNLPYDLKKDLAPVIYLGESFGLIVVNAGFKANTLPELIAMAKASPGQYSVAVPGLGTQYRMGLEQLKQVAGVDLLMVPYKGSPPAINDVIAGSVPIGIDSLVPLAPQVKGGKLRALAVLSATRTPDLPDVPTSAEVGFPDIILYSYNALVAPANTPASVIAKLNAAINDVLTQPDTVAQAQKLGLRLGGGPPEKLKELIDKVTAVYAQVAKTADIKPE
jgi:tripartite-type tricarboxylate transporter receptor subunit TctC